MQVSLYLCAMTPSERLRTAYAQDSVETQICPPLLAKGPLSNVGPSAVGGKHDLLKVCVTFCDRSALALRTVFRCEVRMSHKL